MHGLKQDKANFIRSRSSTFRKLFNEIDLIFLSETWRDRFDSDILDWDDVFIEVNKNAYRDFKKGRSSGGTSLFIRKTIQPYCTVMKHDAYRAWVRSKLKDIYLRIVMKM